MTHVHHALFPVTTHSQPAIPSKWEHPPPTPLTCPNESCFPTTRSKEGYMIYNAEYASNSSKPDTIPTKYFFVLSNNFLLGADNPQSSKLSVVIAVEGRTITSTANKNTMFDSISFVISGKRKTYHFSLCSSISILEEKQEWMHAISAASVLKVTDVFKFKYDIGTGSMGTSVIAAEQRTDKKKVAIKVINKKKIVNKERLSHEINIMKELRNQPCIVQLFDIFESKKHLYLVMELCEGGELLQALATQDNGICNESLTCHIMHQIARAVHFMHEKGIVHRDLKPENILCVKKGSLERVKVADFGISKHISNTNTDTVHTPVGTLTYTAPELLRGQPYGKEVDFWALGVIMHLMLCGYSPWSHCTSELETRRAIQYQNIELVDDDWLHVSEPVKDLVLRLLDRHPNKRATIIEMLEMTWETNTQCKSYLFARQRLRKYIMLQPIGPNGKRRHVSTGTLEQNLNIMSHVYPSNERKNRRHDKYQRQYKYHTLVNGTNGRELFSKNQMYNNSQKKVKKMKDVRVRRRHKKQKSEPLKNSLANQVVNEHNIRPSKNVRMRRRKSRDDSEYICKETFRLSQKKFERYLAKKKKQTMKIDKDDSAFPQTPGISLFSV